MSKRPTVHASVIATVVSGRNDAFILDCIASLMDTTADAQISVRVTVVDNSPLVGLGEQLKIRFPEIAIIANATPKGFATNHNAALTGSDADYLLISNDDVVFQPGALERAVTFMERPENARVGVLGFKLLNPDGSLQPSTYKFPTVRRAALELVGLRSWLPFAPWTIRVARWIGRDEGRSRFWAHDRTVPVDTFRGAVMLVRAAAAREVGPMDEVSLIGGEETEWHRRFWDCGWSIVFLPDAEVIHYGSQTLEVSPPLRAEYLKGLLNYFWKHSGRVAYWTFRALAVPLLLVRCVPYLVTGNRTMLGVTRELLRTSLRSHPPNTPRNSPGAG